MHPGPQIGFIAALDVECASLRKHAPRAGCVARRAERARCRARGSRGARAVDAGARCSSLGGSRAGSTPQLAPGTVVAPRRVLQRAAEPFAVDARWHSRLAVLADEFALEQGDLLTRSRCARVARGAKRAAAAATRAVAVDMESAAIAAVAARAGVPFVVLRVVVDGVADALPRGAEQWIDELGYRRLAATLRAVVNLRQWRPLLTLAKRYRTANGVLDRLAQALAGRRLLAADVTARRAGS